jgi:hypothetical protein
MPALFATAGVFSGTHVGLSALPLLPRPSRHPSCWDSRDQSPSLKWLQATEGIIGSSASIPYFKAEAALEKFAALEAFW